MKEKSNFLSENFHFLVVKFSVYLNSLFDLGLTSLATIFPS